MKNKFDLSPETMKLMLLVFTWVFSTVYLLCLSYLLNFNISDVPYIFLFLILGQGLFVEALVFSIYSKGGFDKRMLNYYNHSKNELLGVLITIVLALGCLVIEDYQIKILLLGLVLFNFSLILITHLLFTFSPGNLLLKKWKMYKEGGVYEGGAVLKSTYQNLYFYKHPYTFKFEVALKYNPSKNMDSIGVPYAWSEFIEDIKYIEPFSAKYLTHPNKKVREYYKLHANKA